MALVETEVVATLVALVAVVAVVAVVAFPDKAPANVVVVSVAVLGLKDSFVEATLAGKFPVLAVTQTGYIVAFVVVSSVIPMFVAFVTVPENAPTKVVAVKVPVLGLNDRFVLETF